MHVHAATPSEQQTYDELVNYTLDQAHAHGAFIHQHAVDAFAAQHADEHTTPITVAFALIGLYLHVELGYSGKQVQRTHLAIGRNRLEWPAFALPDDRGPLTVFDVMATPSGPERDRAIHAWCQSVWRALSMNGPIVAELLVPYGIG